MCVCDASWIDGAATGGRGREDGWLCSAVRIKRLPLSPPPVYVADNQTGFVSSTVSACVCCCRDAAAAVRACVRALRYNIIIHSCRLTLSLSLFLLLIPSHPSPTITSNSTLIWTVYDM